jgi:acetamidase/formamidase
MVVCIPIFFEFGVTQAYVICSVAADLRVSDVVDIPNVGNSPGGDIPWLTSSCDWESSGPARSAAL